ncbi:aminotransferase class V-fold PLP-dependent enzyme [Paraliomyxa miuraensis]|uniref:aminotransferase class V-fold PLP-dependent enzyme n=1 Tax=Paraliomyxa miuraensis TaxID=376150 RepID=UPI0022572E06|nr:aminotransferase class V-fold PLP-dependent enzyme [Paraliomyxa miuraensis]MCX4241693.1 aminotransferase class V-fold PLP-dependent enzyme [Paraliomyxa miuraensis]
MQLDLEFVRAFFPGLSKHWALFDNAGGSVPTQAVTAGIVEYLERFGVQLGASYDLSAQAERRVRRGEEIAAELLGASPEETVVGSSTTVNLATLARALAPRIEAGDEVIVTELDHESNIGPWRGLAAHGAVIKTWAIDRERATLDLSDLEPLLSPRTRLVAFTHCANVVGEFIDVEEVVRRIRANRPDTWIVVDGVAYAPHRLVDVKALDVDAYAVSLYKIYGPHLGALYVRRELLEHAKGQNHFFFPEDALPAKLQPGGVAHELAAGLPGIGAYLDAVAERHGVRGETRREGWAHAFRLFAEHEEQLAERLLQFLREHPRVRIIGPNTSDRWMRAPTIAFVVEGMPSSQVVPPLDQHHVAVRWGHFYARRAIEALGLVRHEGIVRASMVHYNTLAEVERLVKALGQALR